MLLRNIGIGQWNIIYYFLNFKSKKWEFEHTFYNFECKEIKFKVFLNSHLPMPIFLDACKSPTLSLQRIKEKAKNFF